MGRGAVLDLAVAADRAGAASRAFSASLIIASPTITSLVNDIIMSLAGVALGGAKSKICRYRGDPE